ncbi:HAMP domain-containing sensor histidine kinase [Terrabacter sp. NPDC000476]|uniref:sensor histidine kinase n=1 Tax=Terrabacter sp. NPDC000476 TaxID=3154258 RepID=UPI003325D58F
MRTPSLRRRVTVVVLVLVALMLGVLTVTTDVVLRSRLESQLEQRLVDRATVGASLADQLSPAELAKRLEGNGISVLVVDKDGQAYTEGPPPGSADGGPAKPPGKPTPPKADTATPVQRSGDTLEVTRAVGDGATLVLTADAGDVRRVVDQTRIALLVGALAVLALAALLVRPVVARTLQPLDRMTSLAKGIRAGDRGARLKPDRPGTELGSTAHAFDEMLDAVEGAEQHAIDAEQRLRHFLSDAAHELRTPIAGVQAASEHLLRADPPREEREQTLTTLVREARRAGRLVDDMLLMARIDRGLALRPVPVDLTALVHSAVEPRRLRHPGATLTVEGAPLVVTADPDRVVQVVGNLVDNAVRAAGPTGRVHVAVRPNGTAAGTATGTTSGTADTGTTSRTTDGTSTDAVVTVEDDGPGIPAGDRERVFERLVRLDDARARSADATSGVGAGLGLTIARGIARAHGGDLVATAPTGGAGACLRLRLPLRPPVSAGARAAPAGPIPAP